MTMSTKATPARRRDGTCVVCRKPLPETKPQKGVPLRQYTDDPFCSTICARRYFDVEMP